MTPRECRGRRAAFGLDVLRILEQHEDWGADTLEAIQQAADRHKLVSRRGTDRFRIANDVLDSLCGDDL